MPGRIPSDSGFRSLLDRAPVAVLAHREGRVVYANEAMSALVGAERATDLVGSELAGLIANGARCLADQTSESALIDGVDVEVVFVREGSAAAQTVAALGGSADNFRAVIERSPHAMCVCRSDKMIYVNPAMIEYLGYSSQRPLLGPTLPELSDEVIHPDDRARVRDAFRVLFAELGGPGAKPLEPVRISDIHVRRRNDGTVLVCDIHGFIVMHGGAPALVTYLEDLTARRAVEARMRLADRMASLGTLAAGVAHEINNPLAYAVANVELVARKLEQRNGDDGELRLSLAHTQTGLSRIGKIVQGLKAFSRNDEETIGPVDVIHVIESCVEMAQSQLRHRCALRRDFEPNLPPVRGNEARLGQVVLNLLINAAQAFDEARSDENRVDVKVTRAGQQVTLAISDNGPGIPADVVPRIFDPFFTTKAVGAGTGLGLSVCHGIITSLGGEITVESTLGRGTKATIHLPVAEHSADPMSSELTRSSRRARVLLIDDEALLLDVIRRSLDDHDVTTASNAQEGLERIAENPAFDIIFCDLMMPGMSGMELFERLSQSHPDVARSVVFITGGAVTPAAARFLEATSNSIIEKPFDAEQLRRMILERL